MIVDNTGKFRFDRDDFAVGSFNNEINFLPAAFTA